LGRVSDPADSPLLESHGVPHLKRFELWRECLNLIEANVMAARVKSLGCDEGKLPHLC